MAPPSLTLDPCSHFYLPPFSCVILFFPFSNLWLPSVLLCLLSTYLLTGVAFFLFPVCSHLTLLCSITPYLLNPFLCVSSTFNYLISLYFTLLQAMWMPVKAHWWATCYICWAMSTSVLCTSMSRNRRRQERPLLPTLGSWMKLARKETGAIKRNVHRYLGSPFYQGVLWSRDAFPNFYLVLWL